jgi:L-glyceraldehyde 3-phosphate reductase
MNRWIERGLLDVTEAEGMGVVAFSPLGQGMLTARYLDGIPSDSRAAEGFTLTREFITDEIVDRVRGLDAIAKKRGQTLAQMAIAWTLRDQRVTTALVGASRWSQIEDSLGALDNLEFTAGELAEIDRYAVDSGINLWEASSRED